VAGLTNATIPIANEGTLLTYQRITGRLFSNFARTIAFESTANSVYHGLTLELNKRYSAHFQQRLAYTWSKAIDDVPDATAVVPQGADDAKYVQNPLNIRDARAVGNSDQPHRLVINGIWDLRYAADLSNTAIKRILEGWQIAAIFTAQSGQPYTGL